MSRLSYVTVRDLRIQAHAKLERRVPIPTIDTDPHGDLIARVITDVDQVGDGLLQGLTQLFAGVTTIVGTCGFDAERERAHGAGGRGGHARFGAGGRGHGKVREQELCRSRWPSKVG